MSANSFFTLKDVRAELRAQVREAGGAAAFGRQHNISGTHIADVMDGKRGPGKKILGSLGLIKVTLYADKRPGGSK